MRKVKPLALYALWLLLCFIAAFFAMAALSAEEQNQIPLACFTIGIFFLSVDTYLRARAARGKKP